MHKGIEQEGRGHPLIWFVSMPATSSGLNASVDTSWSRDVSHRAASAYDAVASVLSISVSTGSVNPSPCSHACCMPTVSLRVPKGRCTSNVHAPPRGSPRAPCSPVRPP